MKHLTFYNTSTIHSKIIQIKKKKKRKRHPRSKHLSTLYCLLINICPKKPPTPEGHLMSIGTMKESRKVY